MAEKKSLELPEEMVEEILLNLPVKSLLRFSSVSKAWNSMVSDSRFVKRYRGRERFFLMDKNQHHIFQSLFISTSSAQTRPEFESVVCPFSNHTCLVATCDELWLAIGNVDKSYFLWNPSMKSYKRISNPSIMQPANDLSSFFVYGLGFDSLAHDHFKILKIQVTSPTFTVTSVEVYSLRSDSWRDISCISTGLNLNVDTYGLFASGKLHWKPYDDYNDILTFDLSTEKFGSLALPNYSRSSQENAMEVGTVCVLRGILCLSIHYAHYTDFEKCNVSLWFMEDYGVATSWTKMFSIKHLHLLSAHYIMPLYLYENGDVLVRVDIHNDAWVCEFFVYKDDKTAPRRISCPEFDDILLYVDSLVAPWSTTTS